jgi:PBP1b-binding outer membrane lipoprotein LpoB
MPNSLLRRSIATLAAIIPLAASVTFCAGCGGGVAIVRGSQVEGLDDQAMSTGVDKRDIQQALHENLKSLMTSPTANGWAQDHSRPTIAIYPLANETSEHIDSQLNALLSDVETYMVESNLVTVISVERQRQMIAEVEKQHGGGFDLRHVADYNRQLGAKYSVTGKVFTADERAFGERRVQYFMFMQLIDVSTSAVVWQHKVEFTKAIIRS